MTVDDALLAMARADELHDGTAARAVIVEALHHKLLEDPENFWEAFFEALNELRPDPMRELAERLLRSGAVHELTRISDIPAIVADEYLSKQGNDGQAAD
jgi:hypothetical protein